MESVGFDGRLSLNSFIQTEQVYTYEIPMGNRVRIIASQTHTRLPNGWRFCPISIPMGTIFVPYPYPNRGIPHGLSGIGSPLTSLITLVFLKVLMLIYYLFHLANLLILMERTTDFGVTKCVVTCSLSILAYGRL
jgi:hypothetical protein